MKKLSPLHNIAYGLNAGFIDLDGWQTADVYTDTNEELKTAQRRVGLVDAAPWLRMTVEGATAAAVLKTALKTPALEINGGHVAKDGTAVYKLRADHFLVHGTPTAGAELKNAINAAIEGSGELVTLTDISHGSAEIRLIGPDSDDLLSTACGLDLHPSQFPDITAKQSSVAKTTQTIIRRDIGGLLSYTLIGPRSLAVYLWETLMVAGAQFNSGPVGLAAYHQLEKAG